MQQQKPVDVVIAGGGFVGLTLAKEITARTSLSVLVLERGQPRKLSDYAAGMDEVDHALRFRMMQNLAEETATHRHSSRASAVPIRQYGSFNPGTGVGGAGEHWGAICYRFYPEHFKLGAFLREKYGARLPQNLATQDWGVSYEEIEPYYWRAEQLLGVGGKAGNLQGKRVDGGNVFEGPRSNEYPNPPHKWTYAVTVFEKAAREFITLPVASLGGVLLYTLAGEPVRLQAQTGDIRVPLRFFTKEEARVVEAAGERIFPSDETGPGAKEAAVVIYIDRQLAGPYGRDKYRYTKAPFVESVPEHGYQGRETPREIYRKGIETLGNFGDLPPTEQDQKLRAIQTTTFFRILRQHTIEGMFCDPMHGGNAGLIGWQLIGYPGPLMNYRDQIDKAHGQPWRRKPQSLAQIVGHPVIPWEDEKD